MAAEKTLFLFCGDDRYLVEDGARALVNRLVPEHEREFGLDVVNGNCSTADEAMRAVHSCRESLQTESFFGGAKTTWLRDAAFLGAGRGKGADGNVPSPARGTAHDASAALAELVKQGIPPGHTLVISCRKILRTSALFKAISAHGEVNDFGNDLKAWEKDKLASSILAKHLEIEGVSMAGDVREFFLQKVGSDVGMMLKELEKLILSAHPRRELTREDVQAVSSLGRETAAWDILEAFDGKDLPRTLQLLSQYEGQRGAGIMLAAMLEKNVRELIAVRFAIDSGWVRNGDWVKSLPPDVNVLLESSPVNPSNYNTWKLRKISACAVKFSEMELRVARHVLNDLREKLVSSPLPEMALVQRALIQILGRRP